MPSNPAASSLVKSVDNTVVAVLLTEALVLLFFKVVGLLVFSLVAFMGFAVVDLVVLEFSSIVEILSHLFIFIIIISNARKENNFLPQWPIFYRYIFPCFSSPFSP